MCVCGHRPNDLILKSYALVDSNMVSRGPAETSELPKVVNLSS